MSQQDLRSAQQPVMCFVPARSTDGGYSIELSVSMPCLYGDTTMLSPDHNDLAFMKVTQICIHNLYKCYNYHKSIRNCHMLNF